MLNINHYETCCFLYAGNIAMAQQQFVQTTKEQVLSPAQRNIYLSSLNFAIYNFIFLQEKISLHECCLENEQRIIRAASDALLQTGKEIITAYGMDNRYLIAKYQNPHIQQAISYIHAHLNETLTLEIVSNIVCMNKNYFCQFFHKEVKLSFHTYICTQRIRLAKQLLLGTTLSIQEIAEKCGFQTASYFATCCKKNLGLSPSNIRKSQQTI